MMPSASQARWVKALGLLLVVAAPLATATGSWTVSATDAQGDTAGNILKGSSCGATDLRSSTVSYDGSGHYTWTFTVDDAAADCDPWPQAGHLIYFLFQKGGLVVANVVVTTGGDYLVSENHGSSWSDHWHINQALFSGNTATVTLSGISMSQTQAFHAGSAHYLGISGCADAAGQCIRAADCLGYCIRQYLDDMES